MPDKMSLGMQFPGTTAMKTPPWNHLVFSDIHGYEVFLLKWENVCVFSVISRLSQKGFFIFFYYLTFFKVIKTLKYLSGQLCNS